ncbi:MAG TPA: membrane dipeptidase [Chitinophagaceae bacterium]|nr:membrane dipeptidase [Chitinophagaceae bacterium]
MPFFDFHCHPGMKSRLAPEGKEPSPWISIKVQLEVWKSIRINISPAFADALDSQASLHQLWEGSVNLIGLIVHSIEEHVAQGLLEMGIVDSGAILQLDPGKLAASARGNQYYKIATKEIEGLTTHAQPPSSMGLPPGTQLKFIRSMREYNKEDLNTIHALLILEGAQNLFDDPHAPDAEEQFFRNLDNLTSRFRLFAMNLCHFQQQPVANHAFAMQVLNNIEPFYPTTRGISSWGFTVIRQLYQRGILVDLKHLGHFSRKELYRLRAEEGIQLPLICSHAGVTGISEMDRLRYFYREAPSRSGPAWKINLLKKWGHVKDTAYNMISLNLYDEDIEEILLSGGMIGISLDQRIIGFPGDEPILYQQGIYPTDLDYISANEADVFFGPTPPASLPPAAEDNEVVMNFDDAARQNAGFTDQLQAMYFLNQVLHILYVAKHSVRGIGLADGLRSICIGSDLDGLVNPIDCCMSTADYADFKDRLLSIMQRKSFWRGTGFSSSEIDSAALLDGLFFSNAEAFLLQHYQ